ncbi:coilin-like [Bidens hawaiensis]|uniref:coilin-like n=1 Tax=Bidens hawaiensis TaxID=980011 RepID=UPI004049244E
MGTPSSLRIRLIFEGRSILSKTQRSDGMNHAWLLLKLQQLRTISDVSTYLLDIFKLRRSCPNGILLSMEGFALPPFESTEILKDKEIISVKKKGGSTPNACNLLDDVLESEDDGLLHLGNGDVDKEAKEYESESEEVDEEQSQDEEPPEETISKKRKASSNLQNLKKKKQCLAALDDDEDEVETEEIENVHNDASHPKKINSTKETKKMAATSNKKVKSPSTVKRSEEKLQGNAEEVNQVTNTPVAKKLASRSARRKKAKRQWMKEIAKIAKKKPQQAYSKPETTKPKNKWVNDQSKGLTNWKQASKKPVQNGDVGPVVTRPGHIRFESLDEDEPAKQTGVSTEKIKWNGGSSSNRKGQNWGSEKFSTLKMNDHSKRINQESFKALLRDSKVPIIDPNDFDKLPPCSDPKEGDVIAYRLIELNSSWTVEFSSFRVGRISYYDAKDIVLIPVTEYPIVSDKINENGQNDSPYKEDGTLEINYSALVDVRNVQQYDPTVTEPAADGIDQTPMSDDKDAAENLVHNGNDNMDVPADSNPGEVNPWDRLTTNNTEIPEPNNPTPVGSGLNASSHDGPGPSTSTGPYANKPESSEVKESQTGNSIDPWLKATEPNPSQENNSGWSNVSGPTGNNCENGSSWGRPWSAFVVSRTSSVMQNKENNWRAGSSRGGRSPMSRGTPRGRGRGRGGSRGRGRNSN